jgi:hypothetical protein
MGGTNRQKVSTWVGLIGGDKWRRVCMGGTNWRRYKVIRYSCCQNNRYPFSATSGN